METESVILDGVKLEGIYASCSDVDAEDGAVADAIPEDGIVVSTPKTYTGLTVINDIIGNQSMIMWTKDNSIIKTGISDGIIGDFAIIGRAYYDAIS